MPFMHVDQCPLQYRWSYGRQIALNLGDRTAARAPPVVNRGARMQYQQWKIFSLKELKILGTLLCNKKILTEHSGLTASKPHNHHDTAWHVGVHLATTILPHRETQNRRFLIAAAIAEITELAQREAIESHSMESTCGFHVFPICTPLLWACSVLAMLIPLFSDAIGQFLNPLVLVTAKLVVRQCKTRLLGAGKLCYIW